MRFTQGNPVVPEFLQMELLAKGIAMKKISSGMEKNLAGAIKKLDQVQYVVVQDQHIFGAPGDAIPGEMWQPELKTYLDRNNSWNLIKEYVFPDGKKVYLYRRWP